MLGVFIGIGGTLAALSAGYQSMSPRGQWYGETFTRLPRGSKKLALTYDDGPNDPHTLGLLEILAKHDVRATFFLVGRYVEQRPDIVRDIVAAGHSVGNHTFTHCNLIFASKPRAREELRRCNHAITQVTGEACALFRPPFGGRRPVTLRSARAIGLKPVMWSVTGWDWSAPPAAIIEKKVARQIHGGDVILLHDGGHVEMGADRSQTVIATDHLIGKYKALGFEFVTVPEMMSTSA